MWRVYITEYDLVYEDMWGLFPFENVHIDIIHLDQFGITVSIFLTWKDRLIQTDG
jgi:hypothetical protein